MTRLRISLRSGQPATVRVTWRATASPSTCTSRTMSRSTIERCSSGSSTGRRAVDDVIDGDGHVGGLRHAGPPTGISTTAIGRIPAMERSLTPTEFSSAVTAITSAFGDPTRRQIYLFVRDHSDAPTGDPDDTGRGSPPAPWPRRSTSTPTWPATTSTSSRAVATSRSPPAARAPAPAARRSATASPPRTWPSSSRSARTSSSSRCSAGRCRTAAQRDGRGDGRGGGPAVRAGARAGHGRHEPAERRGPARRTARCPARSAPRSTPSPTR